VSGALWVNGRLVEPETPAVSALDHGLLLGDGLYETLAVVGGRAVALEAHLARLVHGAARFGLAAPSAATLRAAIDAVLAADGDAGRVRITLTSGPGPMGAARGSGAPTLIVASGAAPQWAPTARVVTVPWRRNEGSPTAGLKCISQADNVLALAAARAAGADEAILANTRDELCEGAGSNVFLVVDGRLCTPALSSGCLPGVTRALVVAGLDPDAVEEAAVPFAALATTTEAFLTSATRGVQPIASIDGRVLRHAPGPHTRAAAAALARVLSEGG
jgi:branched-chain amino acid aminotransferase